MMLQGHLTPSSGPSTMSLAWCLLLSISGFCICCMWMICSTWLSVSSQQFMILVGRIIAILMTYIGSLGWRLKLELRKSRNHPNWGQKLLVRSRIRCKKPNTIRVAREVVVGIRKVMAAMVIQAKEIN
uniref:Uncharacterized protein n=1 Tax=Opuntia streptacantha TaxID=393608 RepID=A0A7C9DII4_OPUST